MKINRLLVAGVIVVFVMQLYFIDKITSGVRQLKGGDNTINEEYNYKNCINAPTVNVPTNGAIVPRSDISSATPSALNDMLKYYANNYTWTVVIGIPTTAEKREARMRIRSTYLTHYPETYCSYCENPHPNPQVYSLAKHVTPKLIADQATNLVNRSWCSSSSANSPMWQAVQLHWNSRCTVTWWSWTCKRT